ncbi:hypothetical protein pb186bvf_014008 [Paramecium bursaria]
MFLEGKLVSIIHFRFYGLILQFLQIIRKKLNIHFLLQNRPLMMFFLYRKGEISDN